MGELRDGRCDCAQELWEVPCGCSEGGDGHMVQFYRDTPVHFKGLHWRLPCAFTAALAEIERLRALLIDLPWQAMTTCYACGNTREQGHDPECEVARTVLGERS